MLTLSHSQAPSQDLDRASATQERLALAFHVSHPLVLYPLLPPAHRVPSSLFPV